MSLFISKIVIETGIEFEPVEKIVRLVNVPFPIPYKIIIVFVVELTIATSRY